MRQVPFSILTALWAALAMGGGCLAPSGGPTPATPLAPPSSFNATSEESKDAPVEEAVAEPLAAPSPSPAPPPGATAEATPSWTASSAGSVACYAVTLVTMISLSDKSLMEIPGLGAAVTVKNAETGLFEPLADHHLQMRLRVRDPQTGLLVEAVPAALTLDPSILSGPLVGAGPGLAGITPPPSSTSSPSAPSARAATGFKFLEAWIDLSSTYTFRTVIGAESEEPNCADFWEETRRKRFLVSGSYRRGEITYEGRLPEETALPPDQEPALLEPLVLAPRP